MSSITYPAVASGKMPGEINLAHTFLPTFGRGFEDFSDQLGL